MKSAAKTLLDSIKTFKDLDKLIDEGEAESLLLECKSPVEPKLNKDLKKTLAKAISGFSNTNGGVIIWGMSTTKKAHSGLDILTQIEPIGSIKRFSGEVSNKIPTLSIPTISNFENKIIKKQVKDTKGVLLTYIPLNIGDPIQSIIDDYFWYRSGDDFIKTPYPMLKRLFAATESPNLSVLIHNSIMKVDENGFWDIPLTISNESSAVGENTKISVTISNSEACLEIKTVGLKDISNLNPRSKVFSGELNGVAHRGFDTVIGSLKIKMKSSNKKVVLKVHIFANKMRAKGQTFDIKLFKTKYTTKLIKEEFLY